MTTGSVFAAIALAALPLGAPAAPADEPADLVLTGARVYTLEPAQPWAEAVALRGDRILKVGTSDEVRTLVRAGHTRVLELKDGVVLPGFIDNHTHFDSAGRLLLGLNLLEVDEPVELKKRVGEAASRLPAGAWLVGGDWGAYGAWAKGSTGAAAGAQRPPEFLPTKDQVDPVTGDHPALIRRFDGQLHLANTLALRAAGIGAATRDPEGGAILRGPDGAPNGLLRGTAARLVEKVIPPPAYAQRKAEALRALLELRRYGVTSFHDNVPTFDQLQLFHDLRREGALTARVWARMWLSDWERVRDHIRDQKVPAVAGGWGDDMIRLGGLKAWVDGIMGNSSALFFEPYTNAPDSYGRLRPVMFPEGNLFRLIQGADAAGFTVTVHAIGDRANRVLLDTYERVFAANPPRDRRFRVVHAQVTAPEDRPRFGRLGLVAEVQPYHAIDDMRWMEERIGARAENAYAFRGLLNGGAAMSFGSDWPGTNASYYPINPLLGIYAAVTRQTLDGEPAGGWFPRERITLEDAVRFFTWNNAYATFEEDSKGSLKEGKLADLVVLDRDIFTRPPRELTETKVLYTILGGKIVHEAEPPPRKVMAAATAAPANPGAAPAPEVVLVSADAEWRALRQVWPQPPAQTSPFGEWIEREVGAGASRRPVIVFHGGWGKIAAAASTQYAIERWHPRRLVNVGTCGGFRGRIERGEVVLVERTVVYDIVEQMGDAAEAIAAYTTDLDLSWVGAELPKGVRKGPLVSADRDLLAGDIPRLEKQFGAVAGDWESGAIAWTARRNGVPLLILRGVTDLVGEGGGEAYGNLALFEENSRLVMKRLLDDLPSWLARWDRP